MKSERQSMVTVLSLVWLGLSLILPTAVQAAAPRVTTLTSSNVTANTALLRATVNPGSQTTTLWFEWGPGDAIKNRTTPTSAGFGGTNITLSASVSNLTAGTIYHCRAVASNATKVVRGISLPFGVPVMALAGQTPQTNALYVPYVENGATAMAPPAGMVVGDSHTLALRANGTVVAWGRNEEHQATVPPDATNLIAVAAGYIHSLALKQDLTVMGWGTNDYGELSVPSDATNVIALAAGYAHSLALRTNGTVVAWGSDDYGQVTVPLQATNVIAIAAGYSHSLALQADGKVLEWGEFTYGTTGPPPAASNAVAIAAGYSHSVALRANGTVVAWGGEAPSLAAVPAAASNVVAIAAGYSHCLGLRADGTVVGWGLNSFGEITMPSGATNVIQIGAGFGYSQALRGDGVVLSWGEPPPPNLGQTAVPTNLACSFPVTTTGTVNTDVAGAYPLLYRATNVFGYVGTATRSVLVIAPQIITQSLQPDGAFEFGADYIPGKTLTVLASTNITQPVSSWTVLGAATETNAGKYVFKDVNAPGQPRRFYRLRVD